MDLDFKKLDEVHELLNQFSDVRSALTHFDNILNTDRSDKSKRYLGGFLISPELYYSIYEQIKAEYVEFYKELKSKLEQYSY
jgi:hypothetical protein